MLRCIPSVIPYCINKQKVIRCFIQVIRQTMNNVVFLVLCRKIVFQILNVYFFKHPGGVSAIPKYAVGTDIVCWCGQCIYKIRREQIFIIARINKYIGKRCRRNAKVRRLAE